MADAPTRACRFVLDLQADTRQGIADALYNMASQIERGEMTRGVSGGYSSGYIYELTENDGPTHDEWAAQLRAYLDAKKMPADGVTGVICPQTRRACENQECGAGHCATRDGVDVPAELSREHRELMLLAAHDLESWMKSYHRDAATEQTVKQLRDAALGVEGRKP